MKKVVRILGLCALVALAFTSCKKDKQNEELKFMASITQPVNTSKTHIDNATNMLVWDANNPTVSRAISRPPTTMWWKPLSWVLFLRLQPIRLSIPTPPSTAAL